MRRIRIVALLVAPLLIASTVAAGPNYAPGSLDRYFRLEWQAVPGGSGPKAEGYVYNMADIPAERMVLEIDLLDASGNVVGKTSTRVLGGAPRQPRVLPGEGPPGGGVPDRGSVLRLDPRRRRSLTFSRRGRSGVPWSCHERRPRAPCVSPDCSPCSC